MKANMNTWKQSLKYYNGTLDLLESYTKSKSFMEAGRKSFLKNISVHFLEKFYINLSNSFELLKRVDQNPVNFLSLSLILRGIITDVIVYRYLKQIYEIAGIEGFQIEVSVLDADFVRGYKRIFESEKQLVNNNPELLQAMENKFHETFKDFYENGKIKKGGSFRTEDFLKKIEKYKIDNNVPSDANLDTEAGKLKFINDRNKNHIQIVYTYFSQMHHFSGRSFNFYKIKEYAEGNPKFSLLVLFVCLIAFTDISNDVARDEKFIVNLALIANEIAGLQEEVI